MDIQGSKESGHGDADDACRTAADLRAFQAHDSRAFERIWRRFEPAFAVALAVRLHRRLSPPLRARLQAETEDILQEAAITAFRLLPDFDYRGRGSLFGWLSTIVLHAANDRVDYWLAGKRQPADHTRADETETGGARVIETVADTTKDLPQRAHLAERRQQLATILERLPSRQQTIVMWRFFADAGWDEIAAELKAPSADAVRMECLTKVLPAIAAALQSDGSCGPQAAP